MHNKEFNLIMLHKCCSTVLLISPRLLSPTRYKPQAVGQTDVFPQFSASFQVHFSQIVRPVKS